MATDIDKGLLQSTLLALDKLFSFIKNENGVTSIEYALIASLVALGIIATVTALGANVTGLYEYIEQAISKVAQGK